MRQIHFAIWDKYYEPYPQVPQCCQHFINSTLAVSQPGSFSHNFLTGFDQHNITFPAFSMSGQKVNDYTIHIWCHSDFNLKSFLFNFDITFLLLAFGRKLEGLFCMVLSCVGEGGRERGRVGTYLQTATFLLKKPSLEQVNLKTPRHKTVVRKQKYTMQIFYRQCPSYIKLVMVMGKQIK